MTGDVADRETHAVPGSGTTSYQSPPTSTAPPGRYRVHNVMPVTSGSSSGSMLCCSVSAMWRSCSNARSTFERERAVPGDVERDRNVRRRILTSGAGEREREHGDHPATREQRNGEHRRCLQRLAGLRTRTAAASATRARPVRLEQDRLAAARRVHRRLSARESHRLREDRLAKLPFDRPVDVCDREPPQLLRLLVEYCEGRCIREERNHAAHERLDHLLAVEGRRELFTDRRDERQTRERLLRTLMRISALLTAIAQRCAISCARSTSSGVKRRDHETNASAPKTSSRDSQGHADQRAWRREGAVGQRHRKRFIGARRIDDRPVEERAGPHALGDRGAVVRIDRTGEQLLELVFVRLVVVNDRTRPNRLSAFRMAMLHRSASSPTKSCATPCRISSDSSDAFSSSPTAASSCSARCPSRVDVTSTAATTNVSPGRTAPSTAIHRQRWSWRRKRRSISKRSVAPSVPSTALAVFLEDVVEPAPIPSWSGSRPVNSAHWRLHQRSAPERSRTPSSTGASSATDSIAASMNRPPGSSGRDIRREMFPSGLSAKRWRGRRRGAIHSLRARAARR